MRDLLERHDQNHVDDVFESTPLRTAVVGDDGGDDLFGSEANPSQDAALPSLFRAAAAGGRSMIQELGLRCQPDTPVGGAPRPGAVWTSPTADSPAILRRVDRSEVDTYVMALQRAKTRARKEKERQARVADALRDGGGEAGDDDDGGASAAARERDHVLGLTLEAAIAGRASQVFGEEASGGGGGRGGGLDSDSDAALYDWSTDDDDDDDNEAMRLLNRAAAAVANASPT